MHIFGKCPDSGLVAAASSAGTPGRLGILTDSVTSRQFLADSGSVFSLLPHNSLAASTGPKIMAADQSPIPCWGTCSSTIHVDGRSFTWTFLLAAVAFPIIGADFLAAFDLTMDLRRMRLRHGMQGWSLQLAAPRASTGGVSWWPAAISFNDAWQRPNQHMFGPAAAHASVCGFSWRPAAISFMGRQSSP